MYFIQEGFIGIGYTLVSSGITNKPYKMCKTQRNQQLICDHYVINKKKSQFIYMALDDSMGFALKRNYLHNVIFAKFPDFQLHVSSKAFNYYRYWIYKPITVQRR